MKSTISLILFALFFFQSAYSQVTLPALTDRAYQQYDLLISGAISFPYHRVHTYENSHRTGSQVPLSAYLDYGLTNNISIGTYGGYSKRFYRYAGNVNGQEIDFAANEYVFGFRSTLHYLPLLEKLMGDEDFQSDRLDLYVYVMGGYRIVEFININFDSQNHWTGGVMTGARWYLYGGLGIFGELGYGVFGFGNAGLTFRL
ncbi:MAG: hypothetical protein ACK4ND_02500 [Cytophagaceae bacterium]